MDFMLVKPWPPVKPMDPTWLEAYGKKAPKLSPEDTMAIMEAVENFNKASIANAETLNKILLEKVPIPPMKGE